MIFNIFLIVDKSHAQSQTNNELRSIVCIQSLIILFICAIDLRCSPRTFSEQHYCSE